MEQTELLPDEIERARTMTPPERALLIAQVARTIQEKGEHAADLQEVRLAMACLQLNRFRDLSATKRKTPTEPAKPKHLLDDGSDVLDQF